MSKLKVIAVGEVKTASDGRQYFGVDFSAGFGQRKATRQLFQQYKRDPKTGLPTKELYWERGTHSEAMALLKSGELIDAAKVTMKVKPYQIPGQTAWLETYSTVVFADENPISVFIAAGRTVIDEETGEEFAPKKAILASATPSVESIKEAVKA